MEIISREEARKLGLTFFFTGKPCKNGHIAKRYIKGNQCLDCKNNNRNRFRKNNPNYERERRIKHPAEYIKRTVKYTSKSRGIPFNLSDEFFENLEIPENCPACGEKLIIGGDNRFNSPSLDRILNDHGYEEDNVIIVCTKCNKHKWTFDIEWFKFWYDLMLKTQDKLS